MAVRGPVERGIVPNLARPGGNITGLSTFAVATVDAKLHKLARELLPGLSRVAILRSIVDPPGAVENQERTARSLGLQLTAVPFSNNDDVGSVAGVVERSNVQALIAPDTPLLLTHRRVIVQVSARRRLPAIYAFREPVEDGGLMGLYTDLRELGRRGALSDHGEGAMSSVARFTCVRTATLVGSKQAPGPRRDCCTSSCAASRPAARRNN